MSSSRILSIVIVSGALLACDGGDKDARTTGSAAPSAPSAAPITPASPRAPVLADYTLRGIPFAYFQVPVGLTREQLIARAQELHAQAPKAQLILVDDTSQLAQYVAYVKAISGQGELTGPLPQTWADEHIVANVQLYMSGKFVLCEGSGSVEIAELR